MWRVTRTLIYGIFFSSLGIAVVSVFVVHDVDKAQRQDLHGAFSGLLVECVLFALLVGGAIGTLTWLGSLVGGLKDHPPRVVVGTVLGITIPILQYAWDLFMRKFFPQHADSLLGVYLIASVFCGTAVLLYDSARQKQHRRQLSFLDRVE